jgi:hypothetical protein
MREAPSLDPAPLGPGRANDRFRRQPPGTASGPVPLVGLVGVVTAVRESVPLGTADAQTDVPSAC